MKISGRRCFCGAELALCLEGVPEANYPAPAWKCDACRVVIPVQRAADCTATEFISARAQDAADAAGGVR